MKVIIYTVKIHFFIGVPVVTIVGKLESCFEDLISSSVSVTYRRITISVIFNYFENKLSKLTSSSRYA